MTARDLEIFFSFTIQLHCLKLQKYKVTVTCSTEQRWTTTVYNWSPPPFSFRKDRKTRRHHDEGKLLAHRRRCLRLADSEHFRSQVGARRATRTSEEGPGSAHPDRAALPVAHVERALLPHAQQPLLHRGAAQAERDMKLSRGRQAGPWRRRTAAERCPLSAAASRR